MAEPLNTLSAASAAKVREVLARPTPAGKGPGGVPGSHPVEIVKLDTYIGDDPIPHYHGYIRGIPGLDPADRENKGANRVILAEVSGNFLHNWYPSGMYASVIPDEECFVAVRGGQTDDGTPIYWTTLARQIDASTNAAVAVAAAFPTYTDLGCNITMRRPGVYYVYANVVGNAEVSAMGTGTTDMRVRIYDVTVGGALLFRPGFTAGHGVVVSLQVANRSVGGTAAISGFVAVTESDGEKEIRLEGTRFGGGTWTTSAIDLASLGFMKVV